MHVNFPDPGTDAHFQHGVNVALVAVHAPVGEQAENVQSAMAVLDGLDRSGEFVVGEKGAALDRHVDARDFLIDHPSRADVEMADLRVAHLLGGQADSGLRGVNGGMWIGVPQLVPVGLAGEGDGIVGAGLAAAESVQNHE
jgi:hypothetical protein